MKGLILKNQNGYFTIATENNSQIISRSRGKTKRQGNILVGDWVEYDFDKEHTPSIVSVYPRKNVLSRPPVANIDQFILTIAVTNPNPSLFVIDKMLIAAESFRIPVLICINKADLNIVKAEEISYIYKKAGYDSIIVSAIQKTGIDILYSKLRGAVISFSGPSGVGKSSLLNLLIGKEYFNCQEVSSQTGRGKNTTRHSELIKLTNTNYLMDTPGYTALDLNADLADGLDFLFREFRPYLGKCKFNNCLHLKEPACAILKALEEGIIQKTRYKSYQDILTEIHNRMVKY